MVPMAQDAAHSRARGASAMAMVPVASWDAPAAPALCRAKSRGPNLPQLGSKPPGAEEWRWIEATLRRMFDAAHLQDLEAVTGAFRQWQLPAGAVIHEQAAPSS